MCFQRGCTYSLPLFHYFFHLQCNPFGFFHFQTCRAPFKGSHWTGKQLLLDGYKTFNSNWKINYFFKGGVPCCLGAARDEADRSPALEELLVDDLQMLKLINIEYDRKVPPYWWKMTTRDLFLMVKVIEQHCHSLIR